MIGYRSNRDAEAIAVEIGDRAVAMRCDLREANSVAGSIANAAARFGGIGAMIFAVGVPIAQPFVSRIDEAGWREVIETALIGFTRVVAVTLSTDVLVGDRAMQPARCGSSNRIGGP